MSQADNAGSGTGQGPQPPPEQPENKVTKEMQEKSLERMEALVRQSARGVHVLFDNVAIAQALGQRHDDSDFLDFQKMKRMQEVMTHLIARKSLPEKLSYLQDLDVSSYHMLIRTYFHLVEGTVRANSDIQH